jgi:hypothetical protein
MEPAHRSSKVLSSVLPVEDIDNRHVRQHVRVPSKSSVASVRSSSTSYDHPAFAATVRPPSSASVHSLSGASEVSRLSSPGSAEKFQMMLQDRGLAADGELPRHLIAPRAFLDVPQSARTSTSTSSSMAWSPGAALDQFPRPPSQIPTGPNDGPPAHPTLRRTKPRSLVLTDILSESTVKVPEPATPRPLPPSKHAVRNIAPAPGSASPPQVAAVTDRPRSPTIMANSSWHEDGALASATMLDAIAYFMQYPGMPPQHQVPQPSDADVLLAIYAVWRHLVSSQEFLACTRHLYKQWNRLVTTPSEMDPFVNQLCSGWFDQWLDADEEIVDDVYAFIRNIAATQPDQAARLTQAFDARKRRVVLRSDMSALVVPNAAGPDDHTAKTGAPKVYRFLGDFEESTAGRDEFSGQLTVVFNAFFESLIHPRLLVIDWYLNGRGGRYLPLENQLLGLHEDLLKWVAKTIMDAYDDAALVKLVSFWMDICRVRDLASRSHRAATNSRTALLRAPEHDGDARYL